MDPMDDEATMAPEPEEAAGGNNWEADFASLVHKLSTDKVLDPKLRVKLAGQLMKMIQMLSGGEGENGGMGPNEQVEPAVVAEPEMAPEMDEPAPEAIDDDAVQAGGDTTPSKHTEDSSDWEPEEGPQSGGVRTGVTRTMEGKGRKMRMREDINQALTALKANPTHVELAESLEACLQAEFTKERDLKEKLDLLEAKEAIRTKEALGLKLCRDAKLNPKAITDGFKRQLLEARDEKEMKDLIEDRRQITSIQRPLSRNGYVGYEDYDKPPARTTNGKSDKPEVSTDQVARMLRSSRGF